jgi:putative ABC transport system permease protein
MEFTEAVRIATASLWAHKLRSVLTLLGVVIGVTAVIAVVSFINGLNSYVAEKVFNLGADVFVVNRSSNIITNIDDFLEAQRRKKLTVDDYEAVRELCRTCTSVGATLGRRVDVKFGMNYVRDSSLRGYTASMNRIGDIELTAGRLLTETDNDHAARLCVIGYDIYENLFTGIDPIGREVRIDGDEYTIIGVGKKLGSALGQSRDNYVIVPLSTWQRAYGTDQSIRIWGKGESADKLDASIDEVRQILRGRRHLAYAAKDDFTIETNASFLAVWGSISQGFFFVVFLISTISLVVGGIVIMNIMLVSVTERTREIGLRKSLGARRHDILVQFLVESATIAAIGGFLGVFIGSSLAAAVNFFTSIPSRVELWSVLAGLIMATSVGLFFGIYPASKAARLDPVVALRAE